jgi:hypothetical protein
MLKVVVAVVCMLFCYGFFNNQVPAGKQSVL